MRFTTWLVAALDLAEAGDGLEAMPAGLAYLLTGVTDGDPIPAVMRGNRRG